MSIGKEELEAVQRVMQSGVLSGYKGNWTDDFYGGPEIRALEEEWAKYFGVKHAIACNSATSGLWIACQATALDNDEEVIVTPYSMTCSATIPLLFGAKPVFADIEEDYFCLDPKSVEECITEKTTTIIAVDLFGQPCDFDAINEIAQRKGKEYGHKIYVIEDTAQAPGAKYKTRFAGTLGDIGVFSLNYHKHIHCGEGGVVVTNDDELAFKVRQAMNHGEAVMNDYKAKTGKIINPWLVGMNLRMTELSAAIARVQLTKLEGLLEKYRKDAKYFPVKVRPECEHSYYRYAFTELVDCPDGFNMKKGYITPIYKMPVFRHQLPFIAPYCPVVERVNQNINLAWQKEAY